MSAVSFSFNNILKESDYKLITDNYFLKIGKYILVNEDGTYECYNVEKNENNHKIFPS